MNGFYFSGKYAVINAISGELIKSLYDEAVIVFDTKEEAESFGKLILNDFHHVIKFEE